MSNHSSSSASSSNNRQHERKLVGWKGRIIVGPQEAIDVRVIEISEGGCAFMTERPFPSGAELDVMLAVPEATNHANVKVIRVRARVIFQVMSGDNFRQGMQFTRIDSNDLQLIKGWFRPLPKR